MTARFWMCLMTAAATITTGCATPMAGGPATTTAGHDDASALVGPGWPARADDRLTTSGEIYLANLDSQLRSLETRLAVIRDDPGRARLALGHYHRFQVTGRLEDAERARDLVSAGTDRGPQLELAAVQVLMGFHEFDAAGAALERAAEQGAGAARVQALRTALDRAVGADWPGRASASPGSNVVDQVIAAADQFERGRPGEAARTLRAAQDAYRDSSPYTLAWIQLQQGVQFLRLGDLDQARLFFAAAHERFPQYVLVTEHLAETELALGRADVAARLYQTVWLQSGNPEFLAQWARAEAAQGHAAKARSLAERAARAWATRLERYPLLAADHGALYYLDEGQTERALELARENYSNRQDLSARTLLVEVQQAAGRRADACRGWRAIHGAGYAPPELAGLERTCARGGESLASRQP